MSSFPVNKLSDYIEKALGEVQSLMHEGYGGQNQDRGHNEREGKREAGGSKSFDTDYSKTYFSSSENRSVYERDNLSFTFLNTLL